MYDEDDSGPDENDKLFDELDNMVDFAKESIRGRGDSNQKYDVSLSVMELIMEEALLCDIRIYQQIGDSWVAEVKYRGINFIAIAGKTKPQAWDEIFDDDEDNE